MLLLVLRTDKPDAEIGLFEATAKLGYQTWPAHRQLAATLHQKIETLLKSHHKKLADLQGIVCFQGPGSFTGLRIGLTVANTLAYGLNIPVVTAQGEGWIEQGAARLQSGQNDRIALPHYGAPVHITPPKR